MSGLNGDKSRFNRERRQRISRRKRNRELLQNSTEPKKVNAGSTKAKKKEL